MILIVLIRQIIQIRICAADCKSCRAVGRTVAHIAAVHKVAARIAVDRTVADHTVVVRIAAAGRTVAGKAADHIAAVHIAAVHIAVAVHSHSAADRTCSAATARSV